MANGSENLTSIWEKLKKNGIEYDPFIDWYWSVIIISFIYHFIWTNKIAYCRNIRLSSEVNDTRLSPFRCRTAVVLRSYKHSWTDRDRELKPRSDGFVTIMTDRGGLLWSGTSAKNDRNSVTLALAITYHLFRGSPWFPWYVVLQVLTSFRTASWRWPQSLVGDWVFVTWLRR